MPNMKILKMVALMVLLTNSTIAGTESPTATQAHSYKLFEDLATEEQRIAWNKAQKWEPSPEVIALREAAKAERERLNQMRAELDAKDKILRERSAKAQIENERAAKEEAEKGKRLLEMLAEYRAKRKAAGIVDQGPSIFADLIAKEAEEAKAQSSAASSAKSSLEPFSEQK